MVPYYFTQQAEISWVSYPSLVNIRHKELKNNNGMYWLTIFFLQNLCSDKHFCFTQLLGSFPYTHTIAKSKQKEYKTQNVYEIRQLATMKQILLYDFIWPVRQCWWGYQKTFPSAVLLWLCLASLLSIELCYKTQRSDFSLKASNDLTKVFSRVGIEIPSGQFDIGLLLQ